LILGCTIEGRYSPGVALGSTGDGIVVCIGPQRGAAQLFRVEEVDARQPGLVVVHRTDTTAYYGPLYCVQVDRRVAQNVAWSKSS